MSKIYLFKTRLILNKLSQKTTLNLINKELPLNNLLLKNKKFETVRFFFFKC